MRLKHTERVYLRIPILACGSDVTRGPFSEVTATVNISRKGALILLRSIPAQGSELQLTNLSTNAITTCVITNKRLLRDDQRTEFGIEISQTSEDFWGIKFEDGLHSDHSHVAGLVACLRCQQRYFAYFTQAEYLNLSQELRIERSCAGCQAVTDWTICSADEDLSEGRAVEAERVTLNGEQDSSVEMRGAVRYALRVPLHIVRKDGTAEETYTDNLSKTGLMFGCREKLEIGEEIQAIVGYGVAKSPPIMTCKVVRRLPRVEAHYYRYGVAIESRQSAERATRQARFAA